MPSSDMTPQSTAASSNIFQGRDCAGGAEGADSLPAPSSTFAQKQYFIHPQQNSLIENIETDYSTTIMAQFRPVVYEEHAYTAKYRAHLIGACFSPAPGAVWRRPPGRSRDAAARTFFFAATFSAFSTHSSSNSSRSILISVLTSA